MTIRIACAEIDLAALRHNFNLVRHYAAHSRIMCVVKANAYGHGLLSVVDALSAADGFAVSCVDEAIALRKHGVEQPLTVFQGYADETELAACSEYKLWPVLHCHAQLALLEQCKINKPVRCWLKFSTGMNRLGFYPTEVKLIWNRLSQLKVIEKISLMTHMARADEGPQSNPVENATQNQIDQFNVSAQDLEGERCLANSATLLGWPQAQADWVRPGIMLYGASPFLADVEHECIARLKPVMRLSSRLVAINHCRKGDAIGYGGAWSCPEDMPVGVVSIGYGDGYPRHIDANACVYLNGQLAPIVGRVSMDLLTIDLRGISSASVADQVVLWGPELPVENIAKSAETISYELLCGVYERVGYEYVG